MYIASGHGHTTTCYKFWHHFKLLLFPSFCTCSRKIPFASLFYMFLLYYSMHVYSHRARGDNPWGQWKHKGLIYSITGCIFQQISLPSDFNLICFIILYMYIAPGQRQTTYWGQSFYVNRRPYHFGHLLQVGKTLFTLWFYAYFSWFYTCI